MMFSYQRSRKGLIIATIALSALTALGIAITTDSNAEIYTNGIFDTFEQDKTEKPLGFNDGGLNPSAFNDGGLNPSAFNDGGLNPSAFNDGGLNPS